MDADLELRREAYAAFMHEFVDESDRACVILASAEIELRFQQLFEKVLVTNSKLKKDLFDFRGPLGGFSSRVKLAFSMGLIDKEFFEVLEAFRAIRNEIVHKGSGASLADPKLIMLSNEMLKPFKKSPKFSTWMNEHDHLTKTQIEFRYALSFVILMIEYSTQEATKIKLRTQSCDPEKYIQ
jgi:DNA-binding MltR family transcriptional regulator